MLSKTQMWNNLAQCITSFCSSSPRNKQAFIVAINTIVVGHGFDFKMEYNDHTLTFIIGIEEELPTPSTFESKLTELIKKYIQQIGDPGGRQRRHVSKKEPLQMMREKAYETWKGDFHFTNFVQLIREKHYYQPVSIITLTHI